MEDELARTIVAYLIHDPVANVEGYLTEFDKEELAKAEAQGMVIIAEDNNGGRSIVHAGDVSEPSPAVNGIKVVAPSYVDKRTQAIVDVFDALAEELYATAVSVMSVDASEDDTAPEVQNPFIAALDRLKVIANGDV